MPRHLRTKLLVTAAWLPTERRKATGIRYSNRDDRVEVGLERAMCSLMGGHALEQLTEQCPVERFNPKEDYWAGLGSDRFREDRLYF